MTLTEYVAGKSITLILRGIAKIEPPIPSGEFEIVVLIPFPGVIRKPFANEG